jgi:hypothetical protein
MSARSSSLCEVRAQEIIGEQGVAVDSGQGHTVAREDLEVVLHVLTRLADLRVLDQRTDGLADGFPIELLISGCMTHRHIPCDLVIATERQAHQVRL